MEKRGNQKRKSTHFQMPLGQNAIKRQLIDNPFLRHKDILKHYKPKQTKIEPSTTTPTEIDILKQEHRFLRHSDPNTWEERLATKYYEKLVKEYVICQFKDDQVGMRWRTSKECIDGKGQFFCASLGCTNEKVRGFEVLFRYYEDGLSKREMVKVRLCSRCEELMNKSRGKLVERSNKNSDTFEHVETVDPGGDKDKMRDLERGREEDMDDFFDKLLV